MIKKLKWLVVAAVFMLFIFPLTTLAVYGQSFSTSSTAYITSFTAAKTATTVGEPLSFRVRTNATANYVFADCDGVRVYGAYQSADISGNKEWLISCSPKKNQNLTIYVNNSISTVGAAYVTIPVTVSAAVTIDGVSLSTSTIYAGDSVTMTIKTNDKAEHVWLKYDDKYYKAAYQSADASGAKTWTIAVTPSKTQTISISANTVYATSGAVTVEQPVTITPASQRPALASITSVRTDTSSIYYNESVTLTIRTNVETNYVWVDYDTSRTKSARLDNTTSTTKTWSVTISPSRSQTLYVYANSTDSETGADLRNQSITVYDDYYYDSSVTISDAYMDYNASNYVTLTVVTNTAANYVWVEIDGQTIPLYLQNTSSGYKTWTATYTSYGSTYGTAYASSSSSGSTYNATSRSIYVNTSSYVAIQSFTSSSYVVLRPNDYANFTIVTSENVHAVEVRDEFGNSSWINGYNTSGNTRIWNISVQISYVPANTNRNVTFTAEAYGTTGTNATRTLMLPVQDY